MILILTQEAGELLKYVITSYSIHYTKLYEVRKRKIRKEDIDKAVEQVLAFNVITSYSIHYTKLYEVRFLPVT